MFKKIRLKLKGFFKLPLVVIQYGKGGKGHSYASKDRALFNKYKTPHLRELLNRDDVLKTAYKYLESEKTEGQTTKQEEQMFIQGFLQACSWIRESLPTANVFETYYQPVFESYGVFITIQFERNLDREIAWSFKIEDVESNLYESARYYDKIKCQLDAIKKGLEYI
jgi:hypothetical protein